MSNDFEFDNPEPSDKEDVNIDQKAVEALKVEAPAFCKVSEPIDFSTNTASEAVYRFSLPSVPRDILLSRLNTANKTTLPFPYRILSSSKLGKRSLTRLLRTIPPMDSISLVLMIVPQSFYKGFVNLMVPFRAWQVLSSGR